MKEYGITRQASLVGQVLDLVMERISSGKYPPDSQLPPEHELAKSFDVSRATIRSALDILASRGYVRRRQGIGTFVSKLARIAYPLNDVFNFSDLIHAAGFKPSLQHLSSSVQQCNNSIAASLGIEPGSAVLKVVKVYRADSEPVIYCLNFIPDWVLQGKVSMQEARLPRATEVLLEFLESRCGQRVEYYVGSLRPAVAKECLPDDALPYAEPLAPVLIVEEVGYNTIEQPVISEIEYFLSNRISFELVRRRNKTHTGA